MNNYYELIYLNKELKEKIEGGVFDFSISSHKSVLESYLRNKSRSLRLIFSANPNETALFVDQYRPPKKSNVLEFFKPLEGRKIVEVSLAKCDRMMYFHFAGNMYLLFKLFSNNPNVFLVENNKVIDAFKNPGDAAGFPPPEPHAPSFSEEVSRQAGPKKQIMRLNPLLPRNLIPNLLEQHKVDRMEPEEVRQFVDWITKELEENPHFRVLATGETCLWREEVLNMETGKAFDSANDCIRHAYRNTVHSRRLHQKKEWVRHTLERALGKQQSRLEQLKQAGKSLDRAGEYEKYGHLLMAHAHETVAADTRQLEAKDLYGDNAIIRIPLKGRMSIAENAQYYYEKAKESRRFYEKAKQRIEEVKEQIPELKSLLDELDRIGRLPELEKWLKKNDETLQQYGYGSGERQAKSPFRKYEIGKYEVWIGKNAKSNDKLTSLAHKEDVWLHARGVAGSHVVIRMGNQKDFPPKRVILQAAGYAAYFSKARGMKTAPVMYTKVKYVRKPKGVAPGAVVVEREQVEMVPAQKPGD